MATIEELSRALIAADKAGDIAAAKVLAGAIGRMRSAPKETFDPTEGMSGFDKFAAGMGKAAYDTARGLGQFVGAVDRKDVAESRQRDKALMDTGAGMAGNVLGNVAILAPTAAIPGANTIGGAALIGGLTGLAQPSASTGETFGNAMLGGVAGAAVPAVVRGAQAAKSAAEPFYESGRRAILGRALTRAAGNDAAAVAQRLQQAAQPFMGPQQGTPRTIMGEFVPGSIPTAGQAAENAGIAALQRSAAATTPEVTNAITDIAAQQNAARLASLRDLAGVDGRREFFEAARDATANQQYGAARRAGIDAAALTPEAQANIASFAQRIPPQVINRARELAQVSGEAMDNTTSLQGLHWVKTAVDDLIGSATRSGDAQMARAYTGLKDDLLRGIDAMSPQYAQARQTFRQMSIPLNQMDTAAQVMNRSVNPLTEVVQPQAFARAFSDTAAQRATGMTNATLENTLSNQQNNALTNILLDLRRSNAAQNAGRGPGSDTVQKLAYTNILDQAGVPTFLRDFAPAQIIGNLGARGADVAYGRANRELANRLAEVMLDPGQAAQLMLAQPQGGNPLMQLLARPATGAALSLLGIANAQK